MTGDNVNFPPPPKARERELTRSNQNRHAQGAIYHALHIETKASALCTGRKKGRHILYPVRLFPCLAESLTNVQKKCTGNWMIMRFRLEGSRSDEIKRPYLLIWHILHGLYQPVKYVSVLYWFGIIHTSWWFHCFALFPSHATYCLTCFCVWRRISLYIRYDSEVCVVFTLQ